MEVTNLRVKSKLAKKESAQLKVQLNLNKKLSVLNLRNEINLQFILTSVNHKLNSKQILMFKIELGIPLRKNKNNIYKTKFD